VAASAVSGVAAARTAAAKIHAKARMRLKSAKRAIGRAEIIFFFFVPAFDDDANGVGYVSNKGVPRFIVANPPRLCHKPKLHRPADQGLPWRCHCWFVSFME
jgi:hypothetical protein